MAMSYITRTNDITSHPWMGHVTHMITSCRTVRMYVCAPIVLALLSTAHQYYWCADVHTHSATGAPILSVHSRQEIQYYWCTDVHTHSVTRVPILLVHRRTHAQCVGALVAMLSFATKAPILLVLLFCIGALVAQSHITHMNTSYHTYEHVLSHRVISHI